MPKSRVLLSACIPGCFAFWKRLDEEQEEEKIKRMLKQREFYIKEQKNFQNKQLEKIKEEEWKANQVLED